MPDLQLDLNHSVYTALHSIINITKQDIHIYIYMLRIAGQTAGPIGLKLFEDTHGWPGV